MAQLKDLIVNGPSRFIGDVYATTFTGNLKGNADTATSATTAASLTGKTLVTASAVTTSNWSTYGNDHIPTMSFMAYWNGAYSGTSSNLTYCAQGTIIGSNNIGSQSVKYATSSGSCSGNAATATYATSAGSAPASDVYDWAKASTKPSYSFNEITSKPTTISGYGITDALTISNYNSYTPTLTGSGASGTWGINISGRAATATNSDTLDNYHALNGSFLYSHSYSINCVKNTQPYIKVKVLLDWNDVFHKILISPNYDNVRGNVVFTYASYRPDFHCELDCGTFNGTNLIGWIPGYETGKNVFYLKFNIPTADSKIQFYSDAELEITTDTDGATRTYKAIEENNKYYSGKINSTFIGNLTGDVTGNASSATNADKLDGYHADSFSLIGHTHSYLPYKDTRGIDYAPYSSSFTDKGLSTVHLKYKDTDGLNDGGDYHSSIYIHSWNDSSAGCAHNIAFTDNGNFYIRSGKSSWGAWKQLAFINSNVASSSKWVTPRTVTITGSVTGSVSIDGSSNVTLNTLTNHDHRMVLITYANLVSLRNSNSLIPGQQYRITDYKCTTTTDGTKSANHRFDIIVTADSVNKLNEVARAIQNSSYTYFDNCDLNAWKIWYSLDNDTNRFAWADSTNGKGVIYRMIDEFGNDIPYDFKNIQFYRKWDSTTSLWSIIPGDNTGVPCYTFSSDGDSSTTSFTDYSLSASNNIYSNVIKISQIANTQLLSNNCFFGSGCNSNSFGNECIGNSFGYDFYQNIFGSKCTDNSFTYDCANNSFGNECRMNSFSYGCGNNSFGNNCTGNSFKENCSHNSFGNGCTYNTLGSNCSSNSFGNNCSHIKFVYDISTSDTYDYYQYNHFGDGCQYIFFRGIGTASPTNQVQNYEFTQGVIGVNGSYRIISGSRNRAYASRVKVTSSGSMIIEEL